MYKTVTIELPDDLAQQLGISDDAVEDPLQKLITDTLCTLAVFVRLLKDEDATVRAETTKRLEELGVESVIQAVLEQNIKKDESLQNVGYDSLIALAGTLHLGTTDLGEHHDRYLAEDSALDLMLDE